jgi:hypothetical protein
MRGKDRLRFVWVFVVDWPVRLAWWCVHCASFSGHVADAWGLRGRHLCWKADARFLRLLAPFERIILIMEMSSSFCPILRFMFDVAEMRAWRVGRTGRFIQLVQEHVVL